MNPAFNLKVLQSYLPIFNDETKRFIESLDSKVKETEFDIFPLTDFYTLRMVCGNCFFYIQTSFKMLIYFLTDVTEFKIYIY